MKNSRKCRARLRDFMLLGIAVFSVTLVHAQTRPNIVLIYADDLGYGDVSSYGATKIATPNIDKLAARGVKFTRAYATAATCTPSRYSLFTGEYAWRKKDSGIATGDAALLIDTTKGTLPSVLQKAGYTTAAVGKWHLGLGNPGTGADWNHEIKPGPLEIGFDYAFLLPATGDRVPTVYLENRRVVNLDPADPIKVSYKEPIESVPTLKTHPHLATLKSSNGHNQTIVNGIGRIGYMQGGTSALWKDEEIADVLTRKASQFISENQTKPFFLYLATHDIHVPRVPHSRFLGKSGMGTRGDAILQLDWTVGAIQQVLDSLHLSENTIFIFTSDNGPVIDDGYQDQAVALLNGHTPSGKLRGGKYSAFEAGTRVPTIISWPNMIPAGKTSNALVSQVDFMASLAALVGQPLAPAEGPDSKNILSALLGKSKKGRQSLVVHAYTHALIKDGWKYIEPNNGPAMDIPVNIELGNNPAPMLYHLGRDIGEQENVASAHPRKVKKMAALLQKIKDKAPAQ